MNLALESVVWAVVIGGWTSEGGGRFRSLILGVQDKGGLRHLGRVGTGYNQPLL